MTPFDAAREFVLIIEVDVETPFTTDVKRFVAEVSEFELMKFATVVVAIFPFTVLVNWNVFVVVDTVKMFVVPELMTD